MIALKAHAQGTLLPVRVKPGARRATLIDEHDGALRLSVTAPPEDGKANEAVVVLLAGSLQLRRSQFQLINGATSRQKLFLIAGIDLPTLQQRLLTALPALGGHAAGLDG